MIRFRLKGRKRKADPPFLNKTLKTTTMRNTFKNGVAPKKQQAEVLISDKELAMYNYVGLKIAYQQRQADNVLQSINDAHMRSLIKMNNRVTRPFCVAIIVAIVGLIIKNSI